MSGGMKKNTKIKKNLNETERSIFQLNEPEIHYREQKNDTHKWALTKDFTYQDFKKIADQAPFTLKEWSVFLHTSERTLQRYAKEDTAFNGLQIERILLFKQMIEKGNELFGRENFSQWLNRKLFSIEFHTPKEILISHEGVQEVIDLLGRIEHGIVA